MTARPPRRNPSPARCPQPRRVTAGPDVVTITLPRSIVPELPAFADVLNDRTHDLLERNTEGMLSESEGVELENLVQLAQFAQILAMATQQRPG